MPKTLDEWPGERERQEYEAEVDAYFKPMFNGKIWFMSYVDITDLREKLGIGPTQANIGKTWLAQAVQFSAQRQGIEAKVKMVPGGVAFQAIKGNNGRIVSQ